MIARGRSTLALGLLFLVALAVRALMALWSFGRVPAAMDGTFYDTVARRIADGQGYTWLWPDGVVTYAAHYPVGYPGILGGAYALFGPGLGVAFGLNSVLGALAAPLSYLLASEFGSQLDDSLRQRLAWISGLWTALLPTLILYTPALMTEGLVATLTVSATYLTVRHSNASISRWRSTVALGFVLGLATLVRPQSILLSPLLGWISARGSSWSRRALFGATVLTVSLAVVLPWTLRNCQRMDRCMLVSANGGWNLLIGTFAEGKGGWAAVEGERVPAPCREVFAEAQKDECFGRAGRTRIADQPWAWLKLIPDKLKVTFDYTGAAAEYLSRAGAISENGRLSVGAVEIATQRLLFLCALFSLVRLRPFGSSRWGGRARAAGALVGAFGYLGGSAVIGHICLSMLIAGLASPRLPPFLWALSGALSLTALIHAVFFGAGRYSVPLLPLFAPLAALGLVRAPTQVLTTLLSAPDNSSHGPD